MGRSGDYATPANAVPRSLFRKNSLDEMTVRRTEKPVEGKTPVKPQPISPLEETGRTAKEPDSSNPVPVKRARSGIGSYEDSRDTGKQKRRTGKTGRPGR
jgi:excinuclease ABC subunit B